MTAVSWEHRLPAGTDLATTAVLTGASIAFGVNSLSEDGLIRKPARLRCVSAVDGSMLWEQSVRGARSLQPVVDNRSIYVAGSEEVVALDLAGGVRWRAEGTSIAGPWLVGESVVVARGTELAVYDLNGKLLRRRNHRVMWFDGFTATGDGVWFVTAPGGRILCIDPKSLKATQTWIVPGKWAFGCDPVVHDDVIVANSFGGFVTCIDRNSGQIRWRKKKNVGKQGGCRLVGDGDVVVSTPTLARLRVADGTPLWEIKRCIATFTTLGDIVAALAVNDDFSYEVLTVDAVGTITSSLKIGNAPSYGRTNIAGVATWTEHGLMIMGDDVISSHINGVVTRFGGLVP